MKFKEDRLENEKSDPHEASSLKFINVPIVLLAFFIGFGITYLALRTPNTDITPGDSRTLPASNEQGLQEPVVAGNDLENLMQRGKQIYTTTCQACHQSSGAGIPGAFPPLGGSDWVTGPGQRVVAIVLHGLQGEITVNGEKFQGVMPPFKDQLKSEDVAAVATFVRNSFGNKADPVFVSDVENIKEQTKGKNESWNGEAELRAQNWE